MNLVEAGVTPIGFIETNILFAIAAFLLATRIDISEFKSLINQRRSLAWGIASQQIILPLIIISGSFAVILPLGTGTGLILTASMPALTLAALLTWLARGNIALSLLIIFISSLLSTFMTPAVITFWADIHPSAAQDATLLHYTPYYSLVVALSTVLLPALLGLLVRKLLPRLMFLVPALTGFCFALVLCVPAGVLYKQSDTLLLNFWSAGLPSIAAYLGCSLFIFKLMKALNLNTAITSTITLTTVSQNLAIAGMFAISGLGVDSDQILVGLWWVPIQYYGGFLLAGYLRYQTHSPADEL